jgi:glycosyltransferase involved in cell wall biosynthesis
VESVLDQEEIEQLVLVEDGSTDNSLKLCYQIAEKYQKVTLLTHSGNRNRGVSATRNLGIKNAICEYIAFLDADDYYLPDRFKKTKECFEADNSIDGVYEMIGIHTNSPETKLHSRIELTEPEELFESLPPLGNRLWFSIDGLTVKKTIFDKAGLFDESLKTSEDTFQWFKMASVAKLVPGTISHPVTITERRTNSLSTDRKLAQKDFVLMLFKLFKWCSKINCKKSRKELVLDKLIFQSLHTSYYTNSIGISRICFLVKIIFVNPSYVLFQSDAFKRCVGNFIGFNQAVEYFGKRKLYK